MAVRLQGALDSEIHTVVSGKCSLVFSGNCRLLWIADQLRGNESWNTLNSPIQMSTGTITYLID